MYYLFENICLRQKAPRIDVRLNIPKLNQQPDPGLPIPHWQVPSFEWLVTLVTQLQSLN